MARPVNVRVARGDGTMVPCELVHWGLDADGIDVWCIANTEFHPERGDTLRIDEFPARTAIEFAAPGWSRGDGG